MRRTVGRIAALVPDAAGPEMGRLWYAVTYVAADDSLEHDPFAITPTTDRGSGAEVRFEMVLVPDNENTGGGCGWYGPVFEEDVPGVIRLICRDEEGDPLTVTVTRPPEHGTVGAPVPDPVLDRGYEGVVIPFASDPGYAGWDHVEVRVQDDHGSDETIRIEVRVWGREELAASLPALPPGASAPVPVPVAVPPAPATASLPTDMARAARLALGTTQVRHAQILPDVEVWTPRRLSRRRLRRDGRAPGWSSPARPAASCGHERLEPGRSQAWRPAARCGRRRRSASCAAPGRCGCVLRSSERARAARSTAPSGFARFTIHVPVARRIGGGVRARCVAVPARAATGPPTCDGYAIKLRPDSNRSFRIECRGLSKAHVVEAPNGIQLGVSGAFGALELSTYTHADTPAQGQARVALSGPGGTSSSNWISR